MEMAEAKSDIPPDFRDRQLDPALGHIAVHLHLPERVPTRFRNPGSYLMAACRKKFGPSHLLHAFTHERLAVLICSDDQTSASVRSFADDLLARMVEDAKTFRLRLDGTAALSKALVTELTAKLGQPQSVEMKGSNAEHYGDHAFLTTRAPIGWQWPKKLHFRAYGLDMEVRLSLAPESPNASLSLVPGHEVASGGAQGHSDNKRHPFADGLAGGGDWRVVKTNSRVVKAELCRDFVRGVCSRGDKFCIFRHSKAPKSLASEGTGNGRGADSEPTPTRCRDFGRGQCHREMCKFAHGTPPTRSGTSSNSTGSNSSSSSSGNSRDNGSNIDIPAPHARASAAAAPDHAPGASVPSSSSSAPPSSPVASPSSASCPSSSSSSSSSSPSPASSSAPSSPKSSRRPRRNDDDRDEDDDGDVDDVDDDDDGEGEGDDDEHPDDSPPGSLDNPRPARTRSRSWSADEMPHPESPRDFWQKSPILGLPAAPKSVLGKKRPLAQASTPPASTSRPAARGSQQLHAAPLEGAGPAAL